MGKLAIVPCLLLLVAFGVHGARSRLLKRESCGMAKVVECLTKYVGIFHSEKSVLPTDDEAKIIAVHCHADQVLASCAAESPCDEEILNNLRCALLSYAVFDKRARTCPNHNYKDLQNMMKDKCGPQLKRMLNCRKEKDCAVVVSSQCASAYGAAMLSNPKLSTLCTAIPAKAACLQNTAAALKCHDNILDNLNAVFPIEGAKVLAKLCASQ